MQSTTIRQTIILGGQAALLSLLMLCAASTARASITIFGNASIPEGLGPGFSYELGTIFTSSAVGEVIGVRFYMGANEAANPGGDIVGKLWTGTGVLLESATFVNPVQGWNEVLLATPIAITPGAEYVVSANNNLVNGSNYSANIYGFSYPVSNGPLVATAGTYISPGGLFPNNQTTGGASFYGRDILFEPASAAVPELGSLAIWLSAAAGIFGTRLAHRKRQSVQHRDNHRCASHATPRLEALESRLALSGFGPEDGAYVTESWSGYYTAVQATNQNIVAAGNINPHGPYQIGVERYDTLGEVDTSYGSGGLATIGPPAGYTAAYGWALALQGDQAVVAGQFNMASGSDLGIARLDASGAPDSTFGSNGWTSVSTIGGTSSEYADGVGIQSNGDIVVGGKSVQPGANVAMAASVKSNGAVDSGKGGFGQSVHGKPVGYVQTSFGNIFSWFNDIAIQSDDKVVAVGMTSADLTTTRLVIARYTANGTLDTTFNRTGYSILAAPASFSSTQGYAVAIQPDGKMVVAGNCLGIDGADDILLVRYNANGTLDTTFAGAGYERLDVDGTTTVTDELAWSVAMQPDGKIVVGGGARLESDSSTENILVARINANGSLDSGFGTGGFKLGVPPAGHSFHAEGMVLSGNDIILAGEDLDKLLNDTHPLLMRFFGTVETAAAKPANTMAPTTPNATDAALLLLFPDESLTTNKRK